MANTQFFTGKSSGVKNPEKPINQPRKTQFFNPQQERMGTERTANILLLDVSSSMSEAIGNGDNRAKIDGVKEAASTYVVGLPSTAYLSVITFSDTAEILFPLSQLGTNKLEVIRKIQSIKVQNSTNMIAGFECAEHQFEHVALEGFIDRICSLGDGMPNEDPSPVTDRLKASGVQITTIGFGENKVSLDEDLLRRIASTSKTGTPLYYYIKDTANLTGFLKRESKTITQ
ncbi:MAG: VWA domain-containing protein [Candidatus Auribacter fodinae]|jgi:uncharacterized protein YegL|uniref:VWA domain-containing protein n=1 Tax=Candidatus Auribacter fodinae TaxID=2093366 RepID=A0A3A4RCQ3_9BACT|nr:MAG: VWA domain-containing protein [Candidatus Auribacter fodinae]